MAAYLSDHGHRHIIKLRDLLGCWLSGITASGKELPQSGGPCAIDVSGVAPFDTRVLGALLVIREHLGLSVHTRLPLLNLDDEAIRVLNIANFDQLFSFDHFAHEGPHAC